MFSFALIVIIVICLAAIGYIIIKKIPKVRVVDSDSSKVVKQIDVKRKLLEERLYRRFNDIFKKAVILLKPLGRLTIEKIKDWYKEVTELEEKYRHKALKINFKDEVKKQQFADNLLTQASQLIKEDKLNEAEQKYIEILKFDEMNIEAFKGLGQLYIIQKNYEQAKETFEFLLKISENDALVYRSLGEVASGKGDLKQAQEELKKSLELDNNDVSTHLDLAEVYLNLDEPGQAFEVVRQAASLEPNNPKVLDFLIGVSIIVRDKEVALKAYYKLMKVNPENQKLSELKGKIDKL